MASNVIDIHSRFDVSFERGEDVYLFDKNNNKYLDFCSGIAVNCLGYSNEKIKVAIRSQADKVWHYSNLYKNDLMEQYAKMFNDRTFSDRVFFCNSGSEAVEAGIKAIRRYHYIEAQKQNRDSKRYEIICFKSAFHGRSLATIAATGNPQYLEGFDPITQGFKHAIYGDIQSVKDLITDKTAGFLIEPIQGEGGVNFHSKEFLQDLRKLADEHGLLLMFDEVQCGMGRTGTLFFYEQLGLEPDILSSAKGIGGGFPLGATLFNKKTAAVMTSKTHGTTYGSNPLAMSVGIAVLEQVSDEGFLQGVVETANYLHSRLDDLKNKNLDKINVIRGVGLMVGIELNEKINNVEFVDRAIKEGLLLPPAGRNVARLLPPLVTTKAHIDEAIVKLDTVLDGF